MLGVADRDLPKRRCALDGLEVFNVRLHDFISRSLI